MKYFAQLLLVLGVALAAYQATAQISSATDGDKVLVGAWLIVEATIAAAGESTVNRNPQPGLYIFTERHFSTMLVPGGESRRPFSAARTDEERLAAYDNFVADSGTYELQGTTVVTDNIIAKIPNGMTARIPYHFSFDNGDLLLTLESAWAPPGGSITYRLRRLE